MKQSKLTLTTVKNVFVSTVAKFGSRQATWGNAWTVYCPDRKISADVEFFYLFFRFDLLCSSQIWQINFQMPFASIAKLYPNTLLFFPSPSLQKKSYKSSTIIKGLRWFVLQKKRQMPNNKLSKSTNDWLSKN